MAPLFCYCGHALHPYKGCPVHGGNMPSKYGNTTAPKIQTTSEKEYLKDTANKTCPECGYSPIPYWCDVCKVCFSKGLR